LRLKTIKMRLDFDGKGTDVGGTLALDEREEGEVEVAEGGTEAVGHRDEGAMAGRFLRDLEEAFGLVDHCLNG
jgi:hypothetical protein